MTPITKNGNSAKQTIRVFDAGGKQIGSTYPKRAAGLVKKGRAHYVNDFDIRLNASDVTYITEDTKMDNNIITNSEDRTLPYNLLYFNAREWSFNKACEDNVGSRSFMNGPDGELAEAFTIGNWSWDWTEIRTKQLVLPKNTPHLFTFWLNGGENDKNDEVCRFEVIFNSDYDSRYTYNLNRSFIRPVKRLNGWELYEIPFITGDNEYTELRFVAQCAYMTVMAAKEKPAYDGLPDTVDEFEDMRPQRHNIVFQDGWPTDKWYSTKNLRAQRQRNEQGTSNPDCVGKPANGFNAGAMLNELDAVNATLNGIPQMIAGSITGACDVFRQRITAAVMQCGADNADEIIETITEEFGERLSDAIESNIDSMTDQITTMLDGMQNSLEEIRDNAEEQE